MHQASHRINFIFLVHISQQPHVQAEQGSELEPHVKAQQGSELEPHVKAGHGSELEPHVKAGHGSELEPHVQAGHGSELEPHVKAGHGSELEPHDQTGHGSELEPLHGARNHEVNAISDSEKTANTEPLQHHWHMKIVRQRRRCIPFTPVSHKIQWKCTNRQKGSLNHLTDTTWKQSQSPQSFLQENVSWELLRGWAGCRNQNICPRDSRHRQLVSHHAAYTYPHIPGPWVSCSNLDPQSTPMALPDSAVTVARGYQSNSQHHHKLSPPGWLALCAPTPGQKTVHVTTSAVNHLSASVGDPWTEPSRLTCCPSYRLHVTTSAVNHLSASVGLPWTDSSDWLAVHPTGPDSPRHWCHQWGATKQPLEVLLSSTM